MLDTLMVLYSSKFVQKLCKNFVERRKQAKRKRIKVKEDTNKLTANSEDVAMLFDDWHFSERKVNFNAKMKVTWNSISLKFHKTLKTQQCERDVPSLCFSKCRPKFKTDFNPSNFLLFVFCLILVFQSTFAQDDRRCFLRKGGSVQNFFVPESLPVGDVIGEMDIVGNASANGDIYLRLEDPNFSPVQISPNSKKLILTERLDKEGKNGRSHIVISVICQKRKVDDVDIRIPINIRVTDANDNSPIFVNAPYYVNVSEATVKDTIIVGEIKAFDEDQKGPFSDIHYFISPGPHSSKFSFESPMSGTLQLKEPLDYETNSRFNLTIVAQDRGSPPRQTETFVTVQVIDSDDQNPAFDRQRYMALLPSDPKKGSIFEIQPSPIYAEDQDKGIRARVYYSLGNDVPEASYLSIEPNNGQIFLTKDVPDSAFLQPVAMSVMATQVDNPDRVATVILTISRRGAASTQLMFLQTVYEKTINENLPKGTLIANTLINKKPNSSIRFSIEKGGMGTFKISQIGQIFLDYELDYEKQQEYNLDIYVTDGEYNDTAKLKVQVLNVNDWDPRFQYPQYAFYVQPDTALQPGDTIGNITVADGDGDDISLNVRGRDARMFSVNPSGEINIKRLIKLNDTEAHIILVAKDSGKPPRQTSVPVTIHLPQSLVEELPLGMSSSFLLMVVFGSLVAIFILVIICLAVYIHKNKKYRDDKNAAMPTKMSHIISNGHQTKLDPLSQLSHQNDEGSDITGIEAPRSNGSILETNNPFKRGYINGSLRASTISVRSNEQTSVNGTISNQGSKRYSRNPLVNGSTLGGRGLTTVDGGDSLSLNGSNATTASTATAGSDSPPVHGSRASTPNTLSRFFANKSAVVAPMNGSLTSFCTFDGTARATGGLPNKSNPERNGIIPPAPPAPPVLPNGTLSRKIVSSSAHSKSSLDRPSTSSSADSDRKFGTSQSFAGAVGGKRICWPSSTIPKKVKKLSWEDELNSQTELNPEVSVMPMPQNGKQQDIPNLTVYF